MILKNRQNLWFCNLLSLDWNHYKGVPTIGVQHGLQFMEDEAKWFERMNWRSLPTATENTAMLFFLKQNKSRRNKFKHNPTERTWVKFVATQMAGKKGKPFQPAMINFHDHSLWHFDMKIKNQQCSVVNTYQIFHKWAIFQTCVVEFPKEFLKVSGSFNMFQYCANLQRGVRLGGSAGTVVPYLLWIN